MRRLVLACLTALLTGLFLGAGGAAVASLETPRFDAAPAQLSKDAGYAWTWTVPGATADSTTACRWVQGGPVPAQEGTDDQGWFACGSGDVSVPAPAGLHQIQVWVTSGPDGVDEVSPVVLRDDTAPVVTLETEPVRAPALAPAESRHLPTWTFTVRDDHEVATEQTRCFLRHESVEVPVLEMSCSDGTFGPTLQDEGHYRFSIEAVDRAGNPTTYHWPHTYLYDVPPPAPVVTVSRTAPNDAKPVWSWTAGGATSDCTLVGPASGNETGVRTQPDCVPGYAPVLWADGSYELTVVLRDAGGESLPGSASLTYDGTPPDAPVVDVVQDGLVTSTPRQTNDALLEWRFAVANGDTAWCTVLRNDAVVAAQQECTSAASAYTYEATADGAYRLSVVLRDPATNESAAGLSVAVPVDVTPPPPVELTSSPGRASNGGSSQSFTWNWRVDADHDSIRCRIVAGESTLRAWGACSAGGVTQAVEGVAHGTQVVLDVRGVDQVGNDGPVTTDRVLVDRVAPVAPVVDGTQGAGRTTAASWTWSDPEPYLTSQCRLLRRGVEPGGFQLCGSGDVYSLTSDGYWSLEVRFVDDAGNVGPSTVGPEYELDRVDPARPAVTGPVGPGKSTTVTWTIEGEPGLRVACELQRDGVFVSAGADCGYSITRTLGADGDWRLFATLVDRAGNSSPTTASAVYQLDTVAPATPEVGGPEGPGNVSLVTFTWTGAEPGAVAECSLWINGQLHPSFPWARCSSSVQVLLDQDGRWQWQVRLTDPAQNTSEIGTSPVYALDTKAPDAPTVTAPTSPGSSRAPQFVIDGEAGATVECRVLHKNAVFQPWGPCLRTVTVDLATADQGVYAVQARLTDAARNLSQVGRSQDYVLDTIAPLAPGVTGTGGDGFEHPPTWSFTGESATTAECALTRAEAVLVDWVGCTTPWSPNLPAEGAWTPAVRLTDAAGNRGAVGYGPEYRYDATAPPAPTVTGPVTPGRELRPTWTFTGEAGAAASCRLLGPDATSAWSACTSPVVTDLSGRPQGLYRFEVRLTDAARNTSATGSAAYELDTIAPAPAAVVAPPSPSQSPTPRFTVTVFEPSLAAQCRLLLTGTGTVRDWAVCPASQLGAAYDASLAETGDGTYRLEVRLTDRAGNTGPVAGADYVYDTTPPPAVQVAAPLSPGSGRTPSWRLTPEDGAVVQCQTSSAGPFTACAPAGSFSLDLTGAADGLYGFAVRAVDRAGNVGPTTTTTYLLDTEAPLPPVVTGPTPSPGQDRTPVWTWTAERGSASTCSLVRGTTVVSAGACAGSLSVRLPADGAYVLSVTAVDAAGNASVAGTASYVLDTTAPALPVVVGPSSPSSITSPVLGFDAEEGALVECRLSYGADRRQLVPDAKGWQACTEGFLTLSTTEVGTYRLEVRATDAAGNTSATAAFLYDYDPAAPAGLLDLVLPKTPDNVRLPAWTWTAPAGGTTTCTLSGPTGKVVERGPCQDGFRPALALGADGRYLLQVVVVDAAGNRGTNQLLYVLDTIGPDAPAVTPVGATGSQGQVSWGWVEQAGATWECRLERNGRVVQDYRPCVPGPQLLGEWGDGAYVLSVRGVDRVGNRGPAGLGSYTWKSAGPAALGVTTTSPTTGGPGPVLWSFPVPFDAVSVTCGVRRDGALVLGMTECRAGYVMNLTGQRDGLYEVVVRFTDAAGNRTEQVRAYVLSTALSTARPPAPAPAPTPVTAAPAPPTTTVVRAGDAAPVLSPRPPLALSPARAPAVPVAAVGSVVERAPRPLAGLDDGATASSEAVAPPPEEEPRQSLAGGLLTGAGAVEAIRDIATQTIKRPQLPIALLLLVLGFLLVQNRIDRRDPKLALAAVDGDDALSFSPAPRRSGPTMRPGGAPA